MAADLLDVFEELFPICRSITGPGIRQSMEILQRHIPLEIHSIPTGTKVLDWTVPPEWELRRARLYGPGGKCVLDTNENNLHVLNFSEPHEEELELEALQAHLYSNPALPEAVPYVTSYYNRRWGLCLSHDQREQLEPGTYRVEIDTEIIDGVLNYATAELPGESDEIVLVSTYLCHPSMANNELSGPLAMVRVWEALSALPTRRYSYRFVVLPETIGSISYLSKHGDELRDRMVAGVVLTCLGGPKERVSMKLSRRDWVGEPSEMDLLCRHLAATTDTFEVRDFTPTEGSDERQYCSPGFNLPMVQAARTIYGHYDGYHSSADDLEFMTIDAVEKSAAAVVDLLASFEQAGSVYRNLAPHGEPQLGRRGLYPSVNSPMNRALSHDGQFDGRTMLEDILGVLSLSDGSRTILETADILSRPIGDIAPLAAYLAKEGLLEVNRS